MTDRLDAMSMFLQVVDAGSLSGAARALAVPLTTVSRKISELESHLGVRLFLRAGRGLRPTEAGLSYALACRRILDDVAEAERAASGEYAEPKGILTLTAPIVFGRLHLLPVLTEFLDAHPRITGRLIQSDHPLDLTEGHVDVALRIGRLPDSQMVARTVGGIRQIVCASPVYLERHGIPRSPAELSTHATVAFETLTPGGNWHFASGETVEITPRLTVNTAEAALEAAAASLGITRVLCYQAKAALRAGTLTTVLEDHEAEPVPVSLVYARSGLLPQKVRSFLDFAAPRLKSRMSTIQAGLGPT